LSSSFSYREIPSEFWRTGGCLAQTNPTDIWHIRDRIERLDISVGAINEPFTPEDLGEVPSELQRQGKCAVTDLGDGENVLFLRTGNYYNPSSGTWGKKASPLYNPVSDFRPNRLETFRGKPTIFGYPDCGNNGICSANQVLQYDPSTDEWESIGRLKTEREYSGIIEVPGKFCDILREGGTTTTVSTTTSSTETTTNDATTPPVEESQVVLLFGGVSQCQATDCPALPDDPDCPNLAGAGVSRATTAEIFGCPAGTEIAVPDPPVSLTFSAGFWDEDTRRFFICGGSQCFDVSEPINNCYSWSPDDNEDWRAENGMEVARAAHIMGLVGGGLYTAYGGDSTAPGTAEFLNPVNGVWQRLPDTIPEEAGNFIT